MWVLTGAAPVLGREAEPELEPLERVVTAEDGAPTPLPVPAALPLARVTGTPAAAAVGRGTVPPLPAPAAAGLRCARR